VSPFPCRRSDQSCSRGFFSLCCLALRWSFFTFFLSPFLRVGGFPPPLAFPCPCLILSPSFPLFPRKAERHLGSLLPTLMCFWRDVVVYLFFSVPVLPQTVVIGLSLPFRLFLSVWSSGQIFWCVSFFFTAFCCSDVYVWRARCFVFEILLPCPAPLVLSNPVQTPPG